MVWLKGVTFRRPSAGLSSSNVTARLAASHEIEILSLNGKPASRHTRAEPRSLPTSRLVGSNPVSASALATMQELNTTAAPTALASAPDSVRYPNAAQATALGQFRV